MDRAFFYLQHLFTPHYTNNHRPRILHTTPLVLLSIFLFSFHLITRTVTRVQPDILGVATNITIEKLLEYTNQERLANGQGSLRYNDTLARAAEKKAQYMFAHDFWAHNAPDGTTPWDFVIGAGYEYTYAGENLARDFDDSKGVVTAWMNSPSHRDNLLRGEYDDIGFAVVNGTLNGHETTLVVQMFGTPKTGYVAQQPGKTTNTRELPTPPFQPTQAVERIAEVHSLSNNIPFAQGVVTSPLINKIGLERNISFFIAGALLMVLMIDGVIIAKRRTLRIAGHNMAHVIFLITMLGLVIVSTSGSIL
ncbi:CAP domain-containing protein [Candidatus Roizmanbacteria bacterium]|nr:CAP domain-containing protein [Candidatus Roizmanbacteria bacterium]